MRDYASLVYLAGIDGSVAQVGVFQGEFAAVINESFPDRHRYLFDTFTGFDERDIIFEQKGNFSNASGGQLGLTSEEYVLSKMKYPEFCIIKKGIFQNLRKELRKHSSL